MMVFSLAKGKWTARRKAALIERSGNKVGAAHAEILGWVSAFRLM
jgi:hypothetical protein